MTDLKTSQVTTPVVPANNGTQWILVSDGIGTVPVDRHMTMADIYTIGATQAAAALAAIAPIGDVSHSGAVTAGNLAVWVDANTIEDGGLPPDLDTYVTGDADAVPGNLAVFDLDGYSIIDGGTPPTVAGSDTQVQYNDGGAFAGDAYLTWDKTAKIFTVNGIIRARRGVRIITASGPELTTDDLVVGNTASTITVTLLAATGSGRSRSFQNKAAGLFYVAALGGETINGAANKILNQWDSITIVDVSAGEWVIAL